MYKIKKGFTLLELVLVIAIMAVLLSLIIYSMRPSKMINDARKISTTANTGLLEEAIRSYAFDKDGLPAGISNIGTYDLCISTNTNCGTNGVSLQELVDKKYIQMVPVKEGCTGVNSTCIKVINDGTKIEVKTDEEWLAESITCPAGYIGIPGNPLYQTEDFCVMKYEAKNVGGIATSQAGSTPWVSITQTAAITACGNLGTKYHLITNNEWMTIARNIEQVGSNWTSGTVGSGAVYSGHNDNVPPNSLTANVDDNQGYEGTGQTSPANQRRTHTLTNGQVIWDLAGNVSEWNSNVITCAAANCTSAEMPYDLTPAQEWVQFTNLAGYGQLSYDLLRPSNSTWNSTQGFGSIYTDSDAASPSGNVHAFLRGGLWNYTSYAGIFSIHLHIAPGNINGAFGFRCVANL